MTASISRDVLAQVSEKIRGVSGWLTEREIRFLATAAACPTAEGSILEIGAYKGKSTIVIAETSREVPNQHFETVDPFPNGIQAECMANLERAGVLNRVRVNAMTSSKFIQTWDRPVRMLFHDGSNETDVVAADIAALTPYFVDGAILAFHDVLNASGDRAVVFCEKILTSDHFGPVGCCGSIGWAQYFKDPAAGVPYRPMRQQLRTKISRLLPFLRAPLSGLRKFQYKLLRMRVPHHRIDSAKWRRAAA